MISSILSHDEELQVNGALANIGLIADKVWAYDQEDPYRKLNQSLWVQNFKLSETYDGNNGKTTRVRDVIPTSRLAQYGNYEYDEKREKMYKTDDMTRDTWMINELREEKNRRLGERRTSGAEPWMLRQVEEYFTKLVSPSSFYFSLSKVPNSYDEENGKYRPPIPYTIDDKTELQLEARISSNLVKDLWKPRRRFAETSRVQKTQTSTEIQAARKFHESSLQNEKFHKLRRHGDDKRAEIRKNCQQPSHLRSDKILKPKRQTCLYNVPTSHVQRPVIPVLSPEVAEFFPKGPITISEADRRGSLQFFPSSSEPSYQEELFPYNQGHFSSSSTFPHNSAGLAIAVSHPASVNTWIRAPHQWIHRIVPPIQIQVPVCGTTNHPPIYTAAIQPFCPTTIVHRPINLHEKIFTPLQANPAPIPVYQRPVELYQDSSQRRAKNHHQGVDFNNLILLTKNAMKARRIQSKNPQQASSFILESRQPNLKSESDVLQWLNEGYPKRAREFETVNSLVTELTRFEKKCDFTRKVATSTITRQIHDNSSLNEQSDVDDKIIVDYTDVPMITKKRLYRDVLTNTMSREIVMDNVLDKRYDELEQQAREQYRTSEECLAIRYQELERQALDQYKYNDSSSESIRAICSSTLCAERKNHDETEVCEYEDESSETGRNKRCSGFEKRNDAVTSPNRDTYTSGGDKGATMERPITILRSENKCSSSTYVADLKGPSHINARGTITKSLTSLNRETLDIASLNMIKGASGDKMEDQGETGSLTNILHVESSLNNRHLILLSPIKQTVPVLRTDVVSGRGISDYRDKPVKIENGGIASGGGDEKVTILRSPGAQVWLSSFWR